MGSALSKALLQRLGSLKANELSLTIKLRMFRRSSAMTTNIFLRNIASLRACGWCSGKIAHHILLDQWRHQTICKYLWSRQSCPGMEHISYSTQPASSSCQAIMWGSLITSTSLSAKSLSSIMWNSSYHNFILFLCHPYHWNLFHWLQYIFL